MFRYARQNPPPGQLRSTAKPVTEEEALSQRSAREKFARMSADGEKEGVTGEVGSRILTIFGQAQLWLDEETRAVMYTTAEGRDVTARVLMRLVLIEQGAGSWLLWRATISGNPVPPWRFSFEKTSSTRLEIVVEDPREGETKYVLNNDLIRLIEDSVDVPGDPVDDFTDALGQDYGEAKDALDKLEGVDLSRAAEALSEHLSEESDDDDVEVKIGHLKSPEAVRTAILRRAFPDVTAAIRALTKAVENAVGSKNLGPLGNAFREVVENNGYSAARSAVEQLPDAAKRIVMRALSVSVPPRASSEDVVNKIMSPFAALAPAMPVSRPFPVSAPVAVTVGGAERAMPPEVAARLAAVMGMPVPVQPVVVQQAMTPQPVVVQPVAVSGRSYRVVLRTVLQTSGREAFVGADGTLAVTGGSAVLTTDDGGVYKSYRISKSREDPQEVTLQINPPVGGVEALVVDIDGEDNSDIAAPVY